jgi:adenine-specific DNA-methyltransferase
VDIQAQAIQICKLRLWLSLIVDYELPQDAPFADAIRQVPALPNLAYKVRQGDSILERLFGGVVQLDELARDREAQEIVEILQSEKAAYFRLSETPEKRHRELKILELQTALAEKLVEAKRERLGGYQPSLLGEETTKQRREREALEARQREVDELKARVEQVRERVAKLCRRGDTRSLSAEELRRQLLGDPDHPTFLWRVDFAEVFQEKGGFDVMIANPPYVRQEKITHLKDDLKRVYSKVYHGVADIYVYFYAQGLRQLRDDGTLVYISSNKFMRAGYGKTLRRLLGQEVTLCTVIDFGDLPVFEATTYPTVLVMRKRGPAEGHTLRALMVDDIAAVDHLPGVVREQAWLQPQTSLSPKVWTLVRPEIQALLEKLRHSGMPLKQCVQGRFFNGVKTGFNKAFVITETTRRRLIGADSRSAELIKPWLRGRDIDRWVVRRSRQYVLYVTRNCPIERYPAIEAYLAQFRKALERRDGVRNNGPCPWYALSRSRSENRWAFEQPKIIYPHFNIESNFAYDDSGAYGNDKTYVIPEASLFLLGLLNSCVSCFFLQQLAPSVQQGYMEFRTIYVSQIPVPDASPARKADVEALVRKLLDAKGQGPQVAEWEGELNSLVYGVYGLTDQEIVIVEGQC